jgi:pimeloyl-ACP methyl ester carboxylesterase
MKIFFREEGSGRPVILIHGFCETSEIWDGFSSDLAKSFNVFSIDLPGFGKSPLPSTPFSIDTIAQQVISWIDEQQIKSPVLIGHSLGGYVSLSIAWQAPEKVGGLVLFHSTAFDDPEEKKANRTRVIEFVKTHSVDPFIDTFVPSLFRDKKDPRMAMVDKIARKTSPDTLINYTLAMRDRLSRVNFLKDFRAPFLALGGQWDTIVTPEITLQHAKFAPQSSAFLLPESAHIGMVEQRSLAIEKLNEFLLCIPQ